MAETPIEIHRLFPPYLFPMQEPEIIKSEIASDIVWWSSVSIAAGVIGFSAIDAVSFPLSKIMILAVSFFVAALVSKYEVEVPFTSITFQPKTIFAFWGIIWMGIGGGVLLGAAASLAAYGSAISDRRVRLRNVAADTVSTFLAAVSFHMSLSYLAALDMAPKDEKLLVPTEIILASIIMAVVHTLARTLIASIYDVVDVSREEDGSLQDKLRRPLLANALTLCATIVFFLIFNHFGIEFGLVIVPVAVLGNLAYKIHIRRLEQKTKQITEASRLHLATVEALATAIDARDQVGIGHVRRTQIYAVGIGKQLGLSESDIDALRTGALLHDIGKLAVPDHILNKPGKLTPAEMEKTKIHSSVGASILQNVGFPNAVVPTVKYHHECWDGSGYPEQLAGTAIPLTARILSIADAYDTLRGARPYRPAVPRDEAATFLRTRAGSQFDPQIVNLFLRNLKSFEDEIDANGLSYDLESDAERRANILREDNGVLSYVEQIQSANREVFTLYSLAKDFSSALDVDETLSLFTKKIGEFIPFDTCLVYLMDPGEESVTAVHSVGRHSATLRNKNLRLGEGATGYALKQRRAVNNVDPALDFAASQSEIGEEFIAMASLPLMVEEKLIGAISLYSGTMASYEDEHMRLLETVSRIAADAIAKSLHHAQAETYALTDPMTSLPNARSLQRQFEKEVKRASRTDSTFQVLMLDLDGFKAVNDTFGHKAGDRMLKEIASVIRGELREYDFLARYAGDEFVAIVPDTDSHGVLELCRRIEAAVKGFSLDCNGEHARVGVSVGSACYPNHGESFDQILIAADKAMYLTKAVHKQRMVLEGTAPDRTGAAGEQAAGPDRQEAFIENVEIVTEFVLEPHNPRASGESLIVELDESHIIASSAIN